MNFRKLPLKLQDCNAHGCRSGAELFLVEGDSASQAVTAIRNDQFQAVLPMQGKPINASKARRPKVVQFELFAMLLTALGYSSDGHPHATEIFDPDVCRFERIIFLFDPDADGIHCEALMLIFFHRILRPLLESGRIYSVRAPMFRFSLESSVSVVSGGESSRLPLDDSPRYAYSEEQAKRLFAQLESLGLQVKRLRYRGLAGMHRETLLETCVSPESRRLRRLCLQDAEAALAIFGG